MPASLIKIHNALILKYKAGVDPQGKDINKNLMFSRMKVAATDDQLLAVGTSLGGLLAFPLVDLSRQDTSTILSV